MAVSFSPKEKKEIVGEIWCDRYLTPQTSTPALYI